MKAPAGLYKIDLVRDVLGEDYWETAFMGRYGAFKMVTKKSWWGGEYPDWEYVTGTGNDVIATTRKALDHFLAEEAQQKDDDATVPIYINTEGRAL